MFQTNNILNILRVGSKSPFVSEMAVPSTEVNNEERLNFASQKLPDALPYPDDTSCMGYQ